MTTATTAMSTEGTAGVLPLMVWTSPAFPVGAFAYSHGLEWAVESGRIFDAASLKIWLLDLLEHGAPRNDAILAAAAYKAAGAAPAGSLPSLADINELALALAGSRERHLETSQQGSAFVLAARAAWPCGALDRLVELVPFDIAYPVAFATAAAGHQIPLAAALEAFIVGGLANLVSAGVRLGVVGQTDGQRIVAALSRRVGASGAAAAASSLDDLGAAAFNSDLAALRHETQYSRLFRS